MVGSGIDGLLIGSYLCVFDDVALCLGGRRRRRRGEARA